MIIIFDISNNIMIILKNSSRRSPSMRLKVSSMFWEETRTSFVINYSSWLYGHHEEITSASAKISFEHEKSRKVWLHQVQAIKASSEWRDWKFQINWTKLEWIVPSKRIPTRNLFAIHHRSFLGRNFIIVIGLDIQLWNQLMLINISSNIKDNTK